MLSWLGKRVVDFTLSRMRRGDLRPILLLDAKDIRMTFPGRSSWATTLRGRDEHERWLRRMNGVGIQLYADEVLVKGFPWKITICVRGHNHLHGPAGETVYENRYVIWGRIRWGRLKEYEIYEDTQKTESLDRWLIDNEQPRTPRADSQPTSG